MTAKRSAVETGGKHHRKKRPRHNISLPSVNAAQKTEQPIRASTPASKKPPAVGRQIAGDADRYRHTIAELKRALLIAAFIFALLIVLYFLLR